MKSAKTWITKKKKNELPAPNETKLADEKRS
jgi:hypothetical protein